MIIGLVSASLMTAAVSDVVLGVDYIDLKDNKVNSTMLKDISRNTINVNPFSSNKNSTLIFRLHPSVHLTKHMRSSIITKVK